MSQTTDFNCGIGNDIAELITHAAQGKNFTGAAVFFFGKDKDGGMTISMWRKGDMDCIDMGAACVEMQRVVREELCDPHSRDEKAVRQ